MIYFMFKNMLKVFLFALSAIILIAIVYIADPVKLISVIKTGDTSMIFAAFVLSNAAILVRCAKWKVLLPGTKFIDVVPVQLLGVTVSNFSPGKVAEPAKAILLKLKTGKNVSESLRSIIWERILDIVVLLVFAFSALQFLSISGSFFFLSVLSVGVFLFLVFFLVLVLKTKELAVKTLYLFRKFPFVNRINDNFLDTFYKQQIGTRKILVSFILTLVAWLLDGFVFYSAFKSVGITFHPLLFAGFIALATLVGIISFLPGGIGSMEVSLLFILGLQGVGGPVAVSGLLLARFLSIWYVAFLGLMSLIYLGRKFDLKQVFR